ncbi:MAG: hypothetical protein SAJ12_06210 [Jaaginema sp. PMC 1079.18]|nr:hypothetical protein [Jaaginema sp. PMC 1080.18]MEC4850586.1 hypothetical protein [Jaaginema sp. PMC 1079.18]MEC4867082.1 hypothetical protein [Jaaginema sp. PMC 1078.18]
MVDRIQEIAQQARQGSMAALIQYLNERLASVGVRTRAVFDEGVLQLLCEAATVEQLEQEHLVKRIHSMLEELSPRNLRRVNLHARVAREQQLLWLEEINRDPENQLLWSEEITIVPPSFLKQLRQQLQSEENSRQKTKKKEITADLARSRHLKNNAQKFYWQGAIGGILLTILLLGGAIALYRWRDRDGVEPLTQSVPTSSAVVSETVAATPSEDAFVKAVRLAEEAARLGQEAKSRAQWLNLAAQWQEAADLMQTVNPDDPRYSTAQQRVQQYRQNSEIAQQQAR